VRNDLPAIFCDFSMSQTGSNMVNPSLEIVSDEVNSYPTQEETVSRKKPRLPEDTTIKIKIPKAQYDEPYDPKSRNKFPYGPVNQPMEPPLNREISSAESSTKEEDILPPGFPRPLSEAEQLRKDLRDLYYEIRQEIKKNKP
jgi:hypothetical protein